MNDALPGVPGLPTGYFLDVGVYINVLLEYQLVKQGCIARVSELVDKLQTAEAFHQKGIYRYHCLATAGVPSLRTFTRGNEILDSLVMAPEGRSRFEWTHFRICVGEIFLIEQSEFAVETGVRVNVID